MIVVSDASPLNVLVRIGLAAVLHDLFGGVLVPPAVARTAELIVPHEARRIRAMIDRITVQPDVCEGKPTIRGLRITAEFVLRLLGDGHTADDIVRDYPELEKEDVYQAAKYGAWLAGESVSITA
ncbi:MAG: DUF433 domain-containing protein [Phycisphaerales bacterium]|nr:DUF433 domain-containing protein [Phycisphaerales bacterium]